MMREVPVFTSGGRRYLGGHLFTFGRGGGNLFLMACQGVPIFYPLGGGAGFFRDMLLRKVSENTLFPDFREFHNIPPFNHKYQGGGHVKYLASGSGSGIFLSFLTTGK